jgi:serine/alanine adding enzyme
MMGSPTDPSARNGAEGLSAVPFDGPDEEWDSMVVGFEGSTFCHLGAWRGIMTEALGHEVHYRVARDGEGTTVGLLPMVQVRSRLFGSYLLSMPFLSYGGPLGTQEARSFLSRDAVEKAASLKVDLLELRARVPIPGELRTSHRKVTVLMGLPESRDVLWKGHLKAKVRSQIRRPLKEGMETRTGPDRMDAFYRVFSETMRDLGTPVLPRRFFEAIREGLPRQVLFCVVEWKGVPVAAGCGFLWNGEFEVTWAGALRRHSRMAPNMLLYWALMEEALARGAHTFNFGRCSPDSGTHRFKRQWGGEDHPLPWAQWSPGEVRATPNPDSGRLIRLATAVWKKLPLGLANRVGPILSRGLP